ncbi:MAG: outer membrane protein assembly factor BamD [Bacteroidota bacterium]
MYFCSMIRKPVIFVVLILSTLIMSCSSYQKLLKSSDNEVKYTKALEYYEKGDYLKSQQLFEQIQAFFKGTEKAEKIAYYNSYCYYKQKDYILAGYYFKSFATNFSTSVYAEESLYLSAYCSYLDSPRSSLDQTSTVEAISSLQVFISQYPKSNRLTDCNKLIEELRAKLEKKDIDIAMLYYRMSDYKASIVSMSNVLKDYPDTKSKELILYSLLQAKYQYAVNSVYEKRHERLNQALDSYDELVAGFPVGEYSAKALVLKKNISKELQN